jgi:hypothetical protein
MRRPDIRTEDSPVVAQQKHRLNEDVFGLVQTVF